MDYKKKKGVMKWGNFVTVTLFVVIFVACVTRSVEVKADDYTWSDVATGCNCNEAEVGTLKAGVDFAQDGASQNALWADWKTQHPAVVDGDRIYFPYGNATKVYNCHAYMYIGFWSKWLNGWEIGHYQGTTGGCWKAVSSGGTMLSSSDHTCYIDKTGKCGNGFLQYNNDHVYSTMPTQQYQKQ